MSSSARARLPSTMGGGVAATAALTGTVGGSSSLGVAVGQMIDRVPHVLRLARLGQSVALEVGRDDRDVVGTAALVGEVDQRGAQVRELRLVRDHGRELLAPHQAGEPVGADDERVAAAERLVGEVDLHARIGAERLEDDVAPLALLRLFLGELAGVDQPLHERLVLGELDGLAVPDEIGAAVADLREVELVAVDARRR